MSITLSMCSIPSIFLCLPGTTLARFTRLANAFQRISSISVDLPDPDTPVTAVKSRAGR